jgi:hypothetical protein
MSQNHEVEAFAQEVIDGINAATRKHQVPFGRLLGVLGATIGAASAAAGLPKEALLEALSAQFDAIYSSDAPAMQLLPMPRGEVN